MSDSTYPAFPIFAFLGFILALIPLPWHLHAWNAGTCLYMIWASLSCLNQFINSIIWHGNAINWAPVWCDISSRFIIGSVVAIPAASLCINRRLYKIATMRTLSVSRAQKRRAVMVDLAIGLGIPIVEMASQYIVQGHRFDIFEDIGCYPFTYNTPPAYPLVLFWPTALGLVSAVYCTLSLRAFFKRRADFQEFLSSTPSLTVNRYFRLMALATTELLCTTPISAYTIYLDVTTDGINPWKGWADTHYDFSAVDQFPSIVWRSDHNLAVSLEMFRWLLPVCALVFFGFFGFAEEACRQYRAAFWAVAGVFNVSPPKSSPLPSSISCPGRAAVTSISTLPIFMTKGAPQSTPDLSTSTICSVDEKSSSWMDRYPSVPPYQFTPPSSPLGGECLPSLSASDHASFRRQGSFADSGCTLPPFTPINPQDIADMHSSQATR